MGRRSSSDSEDNSKKRKSRRRRRSRSNDSSSSSSSYRKRRSHRSRQSRSPSSRSKHKRSRSRSRSSSEKYRGSRSKKSSRQSRSRSRSRRSRSRSSSFERRMKHRSRASRSPSVQLLEVKDEVVEVSVINYLHKEAEKESSMTEMSTEEQLRVKMQMALKAAADANAALRERGILTPVIKQETKEMCVPSKSTSQQPLLSVSDQMNRAQIIADIESAEFQPQEFKSGRSIATVPKSTQNPQIDDHDIIIFGSSSEVKALTGTTVPKSSANLTSLMEKGEIAHENLFASEIAKQERWIKRLYSWRQKKLNGEVMS